MNSTPHSTRNQRLLKKAIIDFKSGFEKKYPGLDSDVALITLLFYLGLLHLDEAPDLSRMKDLFQMTESMLPESLDSALKYGIPEAEIFEDNFDEIETLGIFLKESSLLARPTILGDLYQMWGSSFRKEALSSIQKADKEISNEELISFTKIYTPDWVVDFLTEKAFERSNAKKSSLKELKIIDPACGSGHFYFGALNYLLSSYAKEKIEPKAILSHILNNQLVAVDIDRRALFVVALITTLVCKRYNIESGITLNNIIYIDLEESEMLGSLNKNLPDGFKLNTKYDVVLTNPPYIGRKLIDRELKARLKKDYPDACFDLSTAFISRCLELLKTNGRFGIITQASFLSLPTYRKLRKFTLENYRIDTIVDLGPGVFPTQSGEKINSALMVFEKPKNLDNEEKIPFFDLRQSDDKEKSLKRKTYENFHVSRRTIRDLYNYAFHYQIPEDLTECFSQLRKLEDVAFIKQGLATTDNRKFVKYIWQVPKDDLNKIWFPYAKGAGESKWYSPIVNVVDWQDNGKRIKASVQKKYPYLNGKVNWVVKNEDFYFKPGLSFSFVSSNGMKVRTLPGNCIFDVGASAVFPKEDTDRFFLLGYLNSSLINAFMSCINPTINNQVGDLKRIPFLEPQDRQKESIANLARSLCETTQKLHELTSPPSIYLNTLDPANNTGEFLKLLESIPPTSIEESERIWVKEIARLKSKLDAKETELNELVIELYATRFGFTPKKIEEVTLWANKFNQQRNSKKEAKSTRNQFLNLLITSKILTGFNHFRAKEMEVHLDRSLSDYIKTDYQSFIGRSFKGKLPTNLLLVDIEEKIFHNA